ncbi:MAG: hypothetical protein LBG78_07320, partial [Azoarcus sp.]|nr:hypothetical protein [Azoarcus sp.]
KPLDVCGENAEFSVGAYFLKDTLGIDIDNFENYPKDIKCFVENATQCDHFSGEQGDTDEERLQEIILAMKKYCGDALAQMPIVKKKYEQDTRINKKVLTICETINTDDNQKSGFHVDTTCALMNLQCPNDVSECLKR